MCLFVVCGGGCVGACVRACVRACVCLCVVCVGGGCVGACVRACERECVCVKQHFFGMCTTASIVIIITLLTKQFLEKVSCVKHNAIWG